VSSPWAISALCVRVDVQLSMVIKMNNDMTEQSIKEVHLNKTKRY